MGFMLHMLPDGAYQPNRDVPANTASAASQVQGYPTSQTWRNGSMAGLLTYSHSVGPDNNYLVFESAPSNPSVKSTERSPPHSLNPNAPSAVPFNAQSYSQETTVYPNAADHVQAASRRSEVVIPTTFQYPLAPQYSQRDCEDHHWGPMVSLTSYEGERGLGGCDILDPSSGAQSSAESSSLPLRQSRGISHRSGRTEPYTLKAEDRVGTAPGQGTCGPPEAHFTTGVSHQCELTRGLYDWIFAVLYPKRRSDKSVPTPSGACRLCNAFCKRPGILRQHVAIVHRQRIARKVVIGEPFRAELALAFVVAQLENDMSGDTLIVAEMAAFKKSLIKGNVFFSTDDSPALHQKLHEFCKDSSWVGVKCEGCGTWLTRPVALVDHAALCTKPLAAPDTNATSFVEPPLRLTAKGLAARPARGNHRKSSPTLATSINSCF